MSLASTCTDDIKTGVGGCEKNSKSNNMDDLLSLYTNKQEKRRIGEKRVILDARHVTVTLYISLL